MPSQVNTGAVCVVCHAAIVAEIDTLPTCNEIDIPVGPGSKDYYVTQITSFHCDNPACMIRYHQPPGKPEAVHQIIEKIQKEQREKSDRYRKRFG